MALEITNANFQMELAQREILVVDFNAKWCGPCKVLGPIIDSLSDDLSGDDTIGIGKSDVDTNSDLAKKFDVRSIPTILFFKGGEVVNRLVGLQSKVDLNVMIDSLR